MPGDRIDEHHRGEFAAGEDVVADRYFAVDAVFDEALVNAFVAATHEHKTGVAGKFAHDTVGQAFALRSEIDNVPGFAIEGLDVLEGAVEHINAHDHALSATERVVVYGSMAVGRVVADVVDSEVEQAGVARPLDDGDIERTPERLREDGQDIDTHRKSVRGPGGRCDHRPMPGAWELASLVAGIGVAPVFDRTGKRFADVPEERDEDIQALGDRLRVSGQVHDERVPAKDGDAAR